MSNIEIKKEKDDEKPDIKQIRRLALLRAQEEYRELLPHLYGFPLYKWTRDFWNSANRIKILCSANQIGKSSCQIRHVIDLATDKTKWPKYFPKRDPMVFWYIYPNKTTATQEFVNKWEKEFMPQGRMKNHPEFGWVVKRKNNEISSIEWNTGVIMYFKSWGVDLQSGTVDYMAVDEELPDHLFPEIILRIARFDGMFSMVFTATLNQKFWYDAIEKIGKKGEKFKDAWKKQISMYDCLEYEDGSATPWNRGKIQKIINSCGTETEVQRRVFGRFVSEKGLMYPSFKRVRNMVPAEKINPRWLWYSGVDCGSGGSNHPASICFVAVSPDFKKARVVTNWKGGPEEIITADGVLQKYLELKGTKTMDGEYYDWASIDFYTFSTQTNTNFEKADKNRDTGAALLNTLFKNQMLNIDESEDGEDLALELTTLKIDANKSHAKDDRIDSLRYAVTRIPWNLDDIVSNMIIDVGGKKEKEKNEEQLRREHIQHDPMAPVESWDYDDEIDEWNDLY